MKPHLIRFERLPLFLLAGWLLTVAGCMSAESAGSERAVVVDDSVQVTRVDPQKAAQQADSIQQQAGIQVADGLELSLWAVDELAPDPIALAIDDQGRAYITRTIRQKNSEFDIRGHRDWMTRSNALETVEDRRAFLREEFAPERSEENEDLPDLNGDGSHDWRDLAVEKEKVFRIEDTDGDGMADQSTLFIEDFHDEVTDVAGGVLPFEDDVYLAVAPDLWRLSDTDGDGAADVKESISHGYAIHIGFSGHGMSGLTVGPDGRIYWSIGDIGLNVVDQDGKRWAYPNQGAILRANPDGSDFEVFAAGVRNTHEFVFDAYGNLISVDNDGDHPGEKERLVYLVNGSDSGWRSNWQYGKYTDPDNNEYKVWMDENLFKPRFDGQAAYITPPIVNYHSGPTGMAYNPGTALGERWNDRFFIAEFTGSPSRSHVYAFDLKPEGAGFEFVGEEEVTSGLLATGIEFGPDGALYVADWLDGWGTKDKGRIWKLDVPEARTSALREETKTLLAGDFSAFASDSLFQLLQHPDMRVRQKGQFALAKRGDEGAQTLLAAAEQTDNLFARLHGLWGLGQLYRQGSEVGGDLTAFLQDDDPEVRAQAAKVIGDVRYAGAGEVLVMLLEDDAPRARFFAAEALGRIAYRPATQPIIAMLRANNDEDAYLRHAGALALARIGDADTIVSLADDSSRAVRIAAVVALRRLQHPGIVRFLQDEDEFIVTEAARAINDDFSIEEALPDLAELIGEERFTDEALLRRVISANSRLGGAERAMDVADFAARPDAPEALRLEALAALAVWPNPSVMDRVDGRYRGPDERDPAIARDALASIIEPLLDSSNAAVKVAAANAVGRLSYEPATLKLADLAQRDSVPDVRIAALEALGQAEYEDMEAVIEGALADSVPDVRMTALRLVPELNLPEDRTADLLGSVLGSRTVEEEQAALEALGTLRSAPAREVLSGQLDRLVAGDLRPETQLDVMEAVEASQDTALVARLEQFRASRSEENMLAAYNEALQGGDPSVGAQIFYRHEAAQCVRCHAAGDWGGGVGPNLMHIASELSREQILESLVDPSARIAPGFGTETVTLQDGQTVMGIVQDESETRLVLQGADGEEQEIEKANIAERTSGPSSMPPMGYILSRRQIRDVVAFLATLE